MSGRINDSHARTAPRAEPNKRLEFPSLPGATAGVIVFQKMFNNFAPG